MSGACADACGNGVGTGAATRGLGSCEPAGDPELEEMLADPTLESCCRRDLISQKRGAALRATLLAADRTDARLQLRGGVACAPGPQQQQEAGKEERVGDDGSSESLDSEEEDDPEVQRLRALRVGQLQAQAQANEARKGEGYGRLNDVPCSHLLKKAEDVGGCCVCHLAVEGDETCNQLDEVLEGLAHRFRRTFFARSLAPARGPQASQLRHALGLTGLPVLVCFREAVVVGRSHLEMFGAPGDILEEEVHGYLRRLAVLKVPRDQAGAGSGGRGGARPAADASSDEGSGSDEEEAGRNQAACEVCGRRYPHEHIRAVYSSRGQDGGGGGSDDDDHDGS